MGGKVVSSKTINSIEMRIISDNMVDSCSLNVMYKNKPDEVEGYVPLMHGEFIKEENVVINGSDYDAWSGDNDVLVTMVLSKLGLTKFVELSN